MKRLSSQDPLIPLVGLLVLGAALIIALVILPVRGRAAAQEQAAAQLRDKASRAERLARTLPALQKQNEDLRARIAALSRSSADPVPDVVREIEHVTSNLGLHLTTVRPGEPQVTETYTKFPTQFEVQASFDRIVRLLYELERAPSNLWVEGLAINKDQSNVLRATVSVAVYTCKSAADEKA